jgi:uncharacterized membrane protein required for colicin V production
MPAALRLTTLDAIVVLLCAVLAFRGATKGFAWQAIRTFAAVGGFFLAGRAAEPVGALLAGPLGLPRTGSDVVGWSVVWLCAYFVGMFVAHLARDVVRGFRLGALDRALGLVLGALLGLSISAFGLVLWASTKEPREIRETLDRSVTVEWMARLVRAVKPAFPPEARRRWGAVLDSLEAGRAARATEGTMRA